MSKNIKKRKPRRFPRVIPQNTRSYRPKDVIVLDTETEPEKISDNIEKHNLILYVAKHCVFSDDGEFSIANTIVGDDIGQFILYLNDLIMALEEVYICSHNLFYDFIIMNFFEELQFYDYILDSFYVKNQTMSFRYSFENKRIIFFDTNDLFKSSVKKLGEALGFDKIEIDFNNCTIDELKIYCERDVDILIKMLSYWYKFYNKHDFGDFKTTLASSAFSAYRHRFMRYPIKIHCFDEINKIERQAYRGGRVEAFIQGELRNDTYYKLDINSMYPYVMMINKFPRSFYKMYKNVSVEFLKNRIKMYACIIKCKIKIDESFIMTRVNGRNIFPVGEFYCTICTPEIKEVLQRGSIIEISELYTYNQEYIFKDYVEYLYPLKEQAVRDGDKITEKIVKLNMNSLYGKFGQLDFEQLVIGYNNSIFSNRESGYDITTNRHYTIININEKTFIEYYGGESSFSFPAIAAHVTAFARIYLFNIMEKMVFDNVFYCDTDGIITNSQGVKNVRELIDLYKVGHLKVEKVSDNVTIFAPKDYIFGDDTVIKGVKKDAIKIKNNTYKQTRWLRFATMLRNDDFSSYYVYQQEKSLLRDIKSGKKQDNGRIVPFRLPRDIDLIH